MYIHIYTVVRFLQRKLIQTNRISRETVFILLKWLIQFSSAPLEVARAACLVSRQVTKSVRKKRGGWFQILWRKKDKQRMEGTYF